MRTFYLEPVYRWLGHSQSITFRPPPGALEAILHVHGHGGKTRFIWTEGGTDDELKREVNKLQQQLADCRWAFDGLSRRNPRDP